MRLTRFSSRASRVATLSTCAIVVTSVLGVHPAVAATSPQLIKNPGAEQGTGSHDGSVVPVPSWTETNGMSFTQVQYGSPGFPSSTSPGPADRGHTFFAGGPDDENSSIVAAQTVSLKKYVAAIKTGTVRYALSAYLGGFASDPDQALVEIDFKDKNGFLIGTSGTLPAVTAADRGNVTGLLQRHHAGKVPKGARSVYVQLIFDRIDGTYNNGFADNLSLTLTGV